jgi:hypothetical protein
MTDEKYSADEDRDRTSADGPPRARGRYTDLLVHRWPTALGVAVAALTVFDLKVDAGLVSSLSVVVVLALVYVGAAAMGRRASWAVLLAGLPVVFVVPATSGINPAVVILLVAAAVFLVVGVVRGRPREPGGLPLQAAGVLAFGATALGALYAAPGLGAYLVAVALLGHAAWDAYHYLRDRVVVRSYAEFCGIADLLIGAAILLTAWPARPTRHPRPTAMALREKEDAVIGPRRRDNVLLCGPGSRARCDPVYPRGAVVAFVKVDPPCRRPGRRAYEEARPPALLGATVSASSTMPPGAKKLMASSDSSSRARSSRLGSRHTLLPRSPRSSKMRS